MKTFLAIISTILVVFVIPYFIGYFINKNTYGVLYDWAFGLGLINIFDGLVIILTLAQITSQYSLQYVIWYHKRKFKIKKTITS
jgi:uncharacterized membrane protein